MKRFGIVPALAACAALAACSSDVTTPAAAPRAPSLSAEADAGQYMVLFKGN